MNDPVFSATIIRRVRKTLPDLPIIARAKDPEHAGELYRAGATNAIPETLESSLQMSESALVEMGVAMGPVIASIHEKRDDIRKIIRESGELDFDPRLKSLALAPKSPE
jgi:CPA2 family monovalent cation:H+ antiporter-2